MRSKRPRKIVVNAVEFHWKTKLALYLGPEMRIVILHIWQIRAGSTVSVWLAGSPPAYIDTAYPKPNDVRKIIECAIA